MGQSAARGTRSEAISIFDPNYTAPYFQNLTLSITRSVQQNLTVDLRYIGTLSRKTFTSFNLNSPNFLYNGLHAEFNNIRAGGESAMLDKMLKRINICATGCAAGVQYSAIGQLSMGCCKLRLCSCVPVRPSTRIWRTLINGFVRIGLLWRRTHAKRREFPALCEVPRSIDLGVSLHWSPNTAGDPVAPAQVSDRQNAHRVPQCYSTQSQICESCDYD